MIYCGTTPKHTFELPWEASFLKVVKITYASPTSNVPILQKRTEDCVLTGNKIEVHLTQQDTFKFNKVTDVIIQIRGLTYNDEAVLSEDIETTAQHCLDTEVLV